MQGDPFKANTYATLGWIQWSSVVLGGVFGAAMKYEPPPKQLEGLTFIGSQLLLWAKPNAWWVVVACAAASAVCGGARKIVGPPWVREAVRQVLGALHQRLFDGHIGPDHRHRVTIFRRRRFMLKWPLWCRDGVWLVPYARTGTSTANTRTVFHCPSEPTKAKGIAGTAFTYRGALFVPGAEEQKLPVIKPGAKAADIRRYAGRVRVDESWIEKRLSERREELPRSYVGLRVEDSGGNLWGVIVIDSERERMDETKTNEAFRLVVPALTILLARGL